MIEDFQMVRALHHAQAPPELTEWVREVGAQEAWDGSDKGDWTLWLAACAGVPLDEIVAATHKVVARVVEHVPKMHRDQLVEALTHAEWPGKYPLGATLDALETITTAGGGHYRAAPAPGYLSAVRAVTLIGRAAESLHGVIQQVADARVTEAIAHGTAPSPLGRPILEPDIIVRDPVQQVLGFVITAAAEAAHEAALALARSDAEEAVIEAEGTIADELHESLEA